MPVEPHTPLSLRLVSLGLRVVHRLSGGRLGSTELSAAAPRGRALKIITAVHRRVYRWTGGLIGGSTDGLPTLLLTTTGRKSGLARTVPLPYFPHPEGYVVVASFAGGPTNPAWYENLIANPDVEVQVDARRFRAVATPSGPEERPGLWKGVTDASPMYADYQKRTPREIPVVVLRAVRDGTRA